MPTNLLLLDESLLVQRVAELAFRGKGVDLHLADKAEDAIAIAEKQPPAVVVASLDMENSDGMAFCRRLRQSPALSGVPLIVLTSARTSVSEADIRELDAAAIEKPFKPHIFTEAVERVIAPEEAADADAPEDATEEEAPGEAAGAPEEVSAADDAEAPLPPEDAQETPAEAAHPQPDAESPREDTADADAPEDATEEETSGEAAGAPEEVSAADDAEAPLPPEDAQETPAASSAAPVVHGGQIDPIIQKSLEEAATRILSTLLRHIETVVADKLPHIVEQIVVREIEKIKRGE